MITVRGLARPSRAKNRGQEVKMSHMVKVQDFQIISLSALRRACARLGYEFRAGQKTARYWNGEQAQVDHAIVVPGAAWKLAWLKNK